MMGDESSMYGQFENCTLEDDADFNEYYLFETGEYDKRHLQFSRSLSVRHSKVRHFIPKMDPNMRTEFGWMIGSPEIKIKRVHPPATVSPNGDLGVFISYFVRKCIFNMRNANATSDNIEFFASIFPFKVSKSVPAVRLTVRNLFDAEFYATISAFMVHHFGGGDSAVDMLDLFLRNIYHFWNEHFDEPLYRRLKKLVNAAADPNKPLDATPVNDYLKQFPRLSQAGITRYAQLRQMYNTLCAIYGRKSFSLGDQSRRLIRMLPEINCYELTSLLQPDFYQKQKAKYLEWFEKYLFFFVYAIRSPDNPVFFIDEPLYECLKGYAQYRNERKVPEGLKLYIWLAGLVHRRLQRLDFVGNRNKFKVDNENLKHIRQYVRKFPGMKSAVVDYVLPTSLVELEIPIIVGDTIFNVFYSKKEKSQLSDFYEGIVLALMCPLNIRKVINYNAFLGTEVSMSVPPLKQKILEFVRLHSEYDPAQPPPVEYNLTYSLEPYFDDRTIQWYDKYPKKSNPSPAVYDYDDVSE